MAASFKKRSIKKISKKKSTVVKDKARKSLKKVVRKPSVKKTVATRVTGRGRLPKPNGEVLKFYCTSCKSASKAPIEKYEANKRGSGISAKGHCSKCDTKLTQFVKNPLNE